MSTIHTISKKERVPYTVVGGVRKERIRKYSSLITILLLNRVGKFYREEFLEEFCGIDFADILCVEGPGLLYDLDARSRKFPAVRFLLLEADVSVGERINLGIEESNSRYIFVIWSDMKAPRTAVGPGLIEKLNRTGNICTVPLLRTDKGELIPSIQIPVFPGRTLKVVPWKTVKNGMTSLYPFDFCGVYDKEKFLLAGEFDPEILNPYWQKLDFGFRSYLWGDKIVCDTSLTVGYLSEVPSEDTTTDAGYKFFYLKNIAVKQRKSAGVLPLRRFPMVMFRSDTGPLYALKEFRSARCWVNSHKSRFKQDARGLAAGWEMPE